MRVPVDWLYIMLWRRKVHAIRVVTAKYSQSTVSIFTRKPNHVCYFRAHRSMGNGDMGENEEEAYQFSREDAEMWLQSFSQKYSEPFKDRYTGEMRTHKYEIKEIEDEQCD